MKARDFKRGRVPFMTCARVAASVCGIPVEELLGESTARRASIPRQIAYWLAARCAGWSLNLTADAFARDYSTVRDAVRTVQRRTAVNTDFADLLREAESALLMVGPAFQISELYRLPVTGSAIATFQSFEVLG